MKKFLSLVLLLALSGQLMARGWDCSGTQKDHKICKLPIHTENEMVSGHCSLEIARYHCTNERFGCRRLPGGCFGNTPPGYWIAFMIEEQGEQIAKRCRC